MFTPRLREPSAGMHGWHAGVRVVQKRLVGILMTLSVQRSLFSQMVVAALADVPLWKVIAGPRRQTETGPAKVRFSFGASGFPAAFARYASSRPVISACQGATRRSIAPTQ
jgi:hypothetical protein